MLFGMWSELCQRAGWLGHLSDSNSGYLALFPIGRKLDPWRLLTIFAIHPGTGRELQREMGNRMPDELNGSPEQDQHQASSESHSPLPQALPTNENGLSQGDSVHHESATPEPVVLDASTTSSTKPNGGQQAQTASDGEPLPTSGTNRDSAVNPPVQPAATTSDFARTPAPAIQNPGSDNAKSVEQEGPRENGEAEEDEQEEYVPRDRWIPEESLHDTTPLIDLLRVHYNGWSSVNLCLVEWEGSQPKINTVSSSIRVDGFSKSIPNLPEGLRKSLLLPTALTAYASTRDLFGSIQSRLQNWAGLSEPEAALLTYWCLATWFPEYLNFVPRLTITGPTRAADSLIQALHSVCCKPIPLASINSAILRTIPFSEFIPTLLIRSSRLNKAALEFLDASDAKGYFVANGKDLQKSQTVKCIYLGEEFKQAAYASDGINIHLSRNTLFATSRVPSFDEIQILQNQLFFYRVYNRGLVQNSSFRVRRLIPELRAVAQQLGAVVPEDKMLQNRIIDLFASQSEQSSTDRAFALNGLVLRAVLYHCHEPDRQKVLVREIAETVNTMCRDLGEPMKFSNEAVGHALKSIGLYTRRLGSTGRGLVLDSVTRREAHDLSRLNDMIPDSTGLGACAHCSRADAATDELM